MCSCFCQIGLDTLSQSTIDNHRECYMFTTGSAFTNVLPAHCAESYIIVMVAWQATKRYAVLLYN